MAETSDAARAAAVAAYETYAGGTAGPATSQVVDVVLQAASRARLLSAVQAHADMDAAVSQALRVLRGRTVDSVAAQHLEEAWAAYLLDDVTPAEGGQR